MILLVVGTIIAVAYLGSGSYQTTPQQTEANSPPVRSAPVNVAPPVERGLQQEDEPGIGLRIIGGLLIGAGVLAVFAAWLLPTTTEMPTYVSGIEIGGRDVHNLGLLQRQMIVLYSGLSAALTGSVLYSAGAIIAALDRSRSPQAPDERGGA